MANKKTDVTIDTVLANLYTSATEFNDKLAVAKEMVKLEMARLKAEPADDGDVVPSALKD